MKKLKNKITSTTMLISPIVFIKKKKFLQHPRECVFINAIGQSDPSMGRALGNHKKKTKRGPTKIIPI